MLAKYYLGLDTAQKNLGVSLLQWDGAEVFVAEVHTFDAQDPPSAKRRMGMPLLIRSR